MRISNFQFQISNPANRSVADSARAGGLPHRGRWGRVFLLAFIFLPLAFSLRAKAQYAIDWYKVSGGGGTSTNGSYALSGTIGQQDAGGPMTGGGYSLTGGFWALYALQAPGAPTLYISHSGSSVVVFWQNVTGWSLQQNSSLAIPAGWSASAGVTTSNGTNSLTITPPTGNWFFRLSHP